MADRTTKVTLTAKVDGYVAGMDRAAGSTKQFSKNAKSSLDDQAQALAKVQKTAGTALLVVGSLAAAGVAVAVKAFADFDAQMAQVQSLSHATAAEMQQLTDAALSVGQQFGYSASQVAEAETELVKAGISVKDILGGALPGALTLAADGQMDVGQATQIAAEAMTQFKLQGKDVPHIADLLAAGADKALGSVGDLGNALESGGLVAAQFGLSIEETVGTLSAFAQAGLLGETAGTDLRQMLLKLGNPSADAAKTMKDLGISIYDAQGQFVGITNLSGQLADKMSKLDPATRNAALATIFGSRAIAGANVLYQNGAKGIQSWIDKVDDQGFAAKQAAGKLDSLNGDVQKLSAAFNTDLIKSGSAANDMLRFLAKTATTVLDTFSGLPQPLQATALGVGAVTAVVGVLGGGLLLTLPKVVAFNTALQTLESSGIRGVSVAAGGLRTVLGGVASVLTGPWGIAIGAAATLLGGVWLSNIAAAQQKVEDYTASLDDNTGAITDNTRAAAFSNLQKSGAITAGGKVGLDPKTLVDAALGDVKAKAAIQAAIDAATKNYQKNAKPGEAGGDMLAAAKTAGDAVGVESDSIKNSLKIKREWLQTTGASKSALDAVAASQAKYNDAVKQDGKNTDLSSAAYKANLSALNDLGAKANEYITTTKNQYDSYYKTAQAQQDMTVSMVDAAQQMGMSRQAAVDYTAKLLGIPATRVTTILADASQADRVAKNIRNTIANIPRNVSIDINGSLHINTAAIPALGKTAFADGGPVLGAGTGTSDSILARLSDGEYVVRASQASKHRSLLDAINYGTAPGFANGGPVYSGPPTYVSTPAGSSRASSVSVSPMVSLQGATLVLTVDGRPMRAMVQEQIVSADQRSARLAKQR